MLARAQAWLTHADDAPPRTERPAATTWLLLPSDVLTVARCALASRGTLLPLGSQHRTPLCRQLT